MALLMVSFVSAKREPPGVFLSSVEESASESFSFWVSIRNLKALSPAGSAALRFGRARHLSRQNEGRLPRR